mgnify:FL=1
MFSLFSSQFLPSRQYVRRKNIHRKFIRRKSHRLSSASANPLAICFIATPFVGFLSRSSSVSSLLPFAVSYSFRHRLSQQVYHKQSPAPESVINRTTKPPLRFPHPSAFRRCFQSQLLIHRRKIPAAYCRQQKKGIKLNRQLPPKNIPIAGHHSRRHCRNCRQQHYCQPPPPRSKPFFPISKHFPPILKPFFPAAAHFNFFSPL